MLVLYEEVSKIGREEEQGRGTARRRRIDQGERELWDKKYENQIYYNYFLFF